jgi:hypothetical protein
MKKKSSMARFPSLRAKKLVASIRIQEAMWLSLPRGNLKKLSS